MTVNELAGEPFLLGGGGRLTNIFLEGVRMERSTPSSRVIRIGAFELDPSTGELTRDGRKTQLTVQLLQVLLALLENPGELVTREELVRRLWPEGTFVDFDHSLNKAVNKLRDALGDSAEEPTYIQTLPRRGYRVIAPVEKPVEEPAEASKPEVAPASAPAGPEALIHESGPPQQRTRRFYLGMAAGAGALALLLAMLVPGLRNALLGKASAHTLTERDTILVADFENKTGDKVFDDALKEGLIADLNQSPFLNILSDGSIRQQLRYMGRPTDTVLTPDLAREVCRRADSKAMLNGSIASMGANYVITLKAVNCESGDPLHVEQKEVDRREKVLRKLHEAASSLRGKLGESLASVEKHDVPMFQDTTSSLEALEAYGLAMKTWRSKGDAAALPLFRRAIEIDPEFAVANAGLAVVYSNLSQPALAADYARRAYKLRDKVTDWERFSIDSTYYLYATGEQEKAVQANEAWKEAYPRSLAPYINLGLVATNLGQLEKALAIDLEGARLAPNTFQAYSNLFYDYVSLDRLEEAKATLEKAHARKLDQSLLPNYYQHAFLQNDVPAMERVRVSAIGSRDEATLHFYHSDTEAFHGRLRSARELSGRAIESALRDDAKETAAGWHASEALREAEFGNAQKARDKVSAALALASTMEVQVAAALALARAGDVARAKVIADSVRQRFPDHTLLNNYWLPCIQASIRLQRNAADAGEILESAKPYEMGGGRFTSGATLYPVYLRGQAFLAARKWTDAAAEFQKIIDHRGLVWNFPLAALAHLQLARAYAGAGNTDGARKSYEDFLGLWQNADPDVPVLRQAKSEFARLK